MPTYDYKCERCDNSFEKFEKMTDRPVGKCPRCGGKAHRLIAGGSGVIFKGTGFYETDYKKKPGSDKSCHGGGSSCKGCPSSGG